MKSFFRLLTTFGPLLVMIWIMKTDIQITSKEIILIVLFAIMVSINRRFLKAGDPVAFCNIGGILFVFSNFFTLRVSFPMMYPATVCYSLMAAAALMSILLKKPFTIHYAGDDISDEIKMSLRFIHINQVMTSFWTVIFITNAMINYFFTHMAAVRILSFTFIIIGTLISNGIPIVMRKYF